MYQLSNKSLLGLPKLKSLNKHLLKAYKQIRRGYASYFSKYEITANSFIFASTSISKSYP